MQHFLVFGNHPRLSLAELRSLKEHLPPPIICGNAAIVQDNDWDGTVLLNRLGGTVKLGDIIGSLPLAELQPEVLVTLITSFLPHRSFDFGISLYGGGHGAKNFFQKFPIKLKKAFKTAGHSTRWVSGEQGKGLSPAAVAKLKLTTEGLDICLLVAGKTVFIGRTTDVQDADAWSLRDYGRPARDDRNGMLPPKLARMMVNFARVPKDGNLLDPFCGGGTVAMEAGLATSAQHLISSDIAEKQVADTKRNLLWLLKQHILRPDDTERFQTFTSDARIISRYLGGKLIDAVVTEGYLGPPLRGHEKIEQLEKTVSLIEEIWVDCLNEFAKILKPRGRIVGVWPAYKTRMGMARVDLTPRLSELGFRLIEPLEDWESEHGPLLYMRPEQHVARRIVILERLSAT
ncbi:hypothetical protein IT408_03410 [Candidatus Uhrbacteria bacterium]|nr:hypothetical protein [Candidatus Uhrbacteria bacterium]